LNSPFDEARYRDLLEGLEAVEIQHNKVLAGSETKRFDPEFFNRTALIAQQLLDGSPKLGDLVKNGYRVVYETTQAIDREQGIQVGLPFFLQSSDISTPFIDAEAMICVSEDDWVRYPKGRIQAGELLIEVKGKAEKIAIVPDDFPEKTLVTGTCFKLTTKEPDDRYILTAYLTCKYGQALKERLKTNLLVSYLAKDDLYSLPVPRVSTEFRDAIKSIFQRCFLAQSHSKTLQDDAEQTLHSVLGLENWQPLEPLTYIRPSRDAFAAGRLDAEYFYPAKQAALDLLASMPGKTVGEMFGSVRDLWQPENANQAELVRNYDLTDALSPFLDITKEPTTPDTISSTKKRIAKGDIVVSRLRSYLKEIAVVLDGDNISMVGSTEFIVLRPQKQSVRIETLLVYLRSTLPQLIFKWSQDGSNHPRFNEKELLNLRVPDIIIEHEDEIVEKVQSAIRSRRRATELLEAAKRAVEIAIEDSERAALAYLESVKEA
jgi:type I restriction enzyme S subunit